MSFLIVGQKFYKIRLFINHFYIAYTCILPWITAKADSGACIGEHIITTFVYIIKRVCLRVKIVK